jgi:hypothetical protein
MVANAALIETSDPEGLRQYFVQKIEELNLTVSEKQQNLRRLQVFIIEVFIDTYLIFNVHYFLCLMTFYLSTSKYKFSLKRSRLIIQNYQGLNNLFSLNDFY